jgi:hypothetical protein
MRESSLVGLALVCFAVSATACGGGHVDAVVTTPPPPTANVSITAGGTTGTTGTTTTNTATPPPTTTTTPPPTPTGGPAQPVSPSMDAAAGPAIDLMAKSDAKGMQPEGSAFAGQFTEGQTLEQTFNAVPGKCYTAFAVGTGTITQLDLTAMTVSPSPAIPAITVAQSNTTGPQASIGGGGNCVKYPLPIGGPFKVVIKATHGQGIAVGRVYSK